MTGGRLAATGYGRTCLVPSRPWRRQSADAQDAIRDADLAVCDDGLVLKDRLGVYAPDPSTTTVDPGLVEILRVEGEVYR